MSTEISDLQGTTVLIVVPCLNEEEHIAGILRQFSDEARRINAILVVVDGGSNDRTVAIVKSICERESRVKLLHNPQRIQSSSINLAVSTFGRNASIIIRVDVHAVYPADYCSKLMAVQSEMGADSVVVSMIAKGNNCFQTAAAIAQNSRLGNGGAAHRTRSCGRFVDHGHHALMMLNAFRRVGGYDESFSHNEDAELDTRLRSAGYRIFLAADPTIIYLPRKTARALLNQYYNFGKGRAKNLLKHRSRPRVRQLIPILVTPAIALCLLQPWISFAGIPAAFWALLCLSYGFALGIRERSVCGCISGLAAMAMHAGFSAGFIGTFLRAYTFKGNFGGDGKIV